MATKIARAHVFIEGSVQTVSYRYWTKKNAERLNINGWVKNLTEGRVEAVFEGSKTAVEEIIKKCRKGPMLAVVRHIDVVWEDATKEFKNFEIMA